MRRHNYFHTRRTVFTPTAASRKQGMIATPTGWQYYTKPYNPRHLPVILRAAEIDPDAVYWVISDGIPDDYGFIWEYEFYIRQQS